MDPNTNREATSVRPTWHRLLFIAGIVLLLALCLAWAQSSWALAPYLGFTPPAELQGHVTLQGRPAAPHASWSIPLYVSICPLGGPVSSTVVTTDQSGNFSVPGLPAGIYSISVKGAHTLRALQQDVALAAPSTSIDFGTLAEGDTNHDNVINAIDASAMATSYWKAEGDAGFEPNADFNEDDYIDARDASLLATNYWKSGDPLPVPTIPPPTVPLPTIPPPTIPVKDRQAAVDLKSVSAAEMATVHTETAAEADILITPPLAMIPVGKTFVLTVEVDSAGQTIQAADIFIQFDPRFLCVVDAAGQPATQVAPITDTMSSVLMNQVDIQGGLIAYAVMETNAYTPSGNVRLFQIPLRALAPTGPGGTSLNFMFDDATHHVTRLAYGGYDLLRDSYPAAVRAFSSKVLVIPQVLKGRLMDDPYEP